MVINLFVAIPADTVLAKGNDKAGKTGNTVQIGVGKDSHTLKRDELADPLNEYGIKEHSHTKRRGDKETDLNTVVYENADGSETTYIFQETVKYVDESGNVKDKSNKLVANDKDNSAKFAGRMKDGNAGNNTDKIAKNYAYVNDQNDINTYFPQLLGKNSGVVLNYGDLNIEMYPKDTVSPVSKVGDKEIIYENVFESTAQLQYETTFDGYKENIVIFDDSENTFTFIAEAKGMYV